MRKQLEGEKSLNNTLDYDLQRLNVFGDTYEELMMYISYFKDFTIFPLDTIESLISKIYIITGSNTNTEYFLNQMGYKTVVKDNKEVDVDYNLISQFREETLLRGEFGYFYSKANQFMYEITVRRKYEIFNAESWLPMVAIKGKYIVKDK